VDSNWIGTNNNKTLIYRCGDTSRQNYTNSNIQQQHALKMHHTHGAKTQYIEENQDSPLLPQKDVTRIQQLAGTLLYYARAVDPTLVLPVNVLASEQTQATAATADKVITLISYCATHPEAKLQYHASDMILNIHSDASYLSEREAKSRSGGFLYM
jgi:hypothetical protein